MLGIGHSLWLRSTFAASGIGEEERDRSDLVSQGAQTHPGVTHRSAGMSQDRPGPCSFGAHIGFWILSRCLEPETARLLCHKGGESDLISRLGDWGKKELNESSK